MVRALKVEGHHPLIVLPKKYMAAATIPNHVAGAEGAPYRLLTPAEKALRQLWADGGVLFAPQHYWTDDDIYWMYLTVVRDGGPRVAVVTNDHARDHRAWLLANNHARAYARWQTNHVRRFDFGPPRANEPGGAPAAVSIHPLPRFSREVQRAARDDGVVHWHFPVEDADAPGTHEEKLETRWLCLQLPGQVPGARRQEQAPEQGALEMLISRTEGKARVPLSK